MCETAELFGVWSVFLRCTWGERRTCVCYFSLKMMTSLWLTLMLTALQLCLLQRLQILLLLLLFWAVRWTTLRQPPRCCTAATRGTRVRVREHCA